MKLVTFNIRCDYNQDGNNSFCYRKPYILQKIRSEAPDMICFQEVLPHVAAWLKQELPEYMVIGCGRSETLEDEQATIAFRKERFNLMSMETYWLSPTPYVPASRYADQSICPRVCTEAVFEDLKTKTVFRVLNTHLDHEGPGARKEGLNQILNKLEANVFYPDAPVIITGDMNAEPDSEEMSEIIQNPEYCNATQGIGVTFHGYGNPETFCTIDYIFIRGALQATEVSAWRDVANGVYLSDHYPVCAVIK